MKKGIHPRVYNTLAILSNSSMTHYTTIINTKILKIDTDQQLLKHLRKKLKITKSVDRIHKFKNKFAI